MPCGELVIIMGLMCTDLYQGVPLELTLSDPYQLYSHLAKMGIEGKNLDLKFHLTDKK